VYLPLGLAHRQLSKICNDNMIGKLKGESNLYLIIVALFIAVNVSVHFSPLSMYMYPWYAIYLVFIILTIRQHINEDFIFAKLSSFVEMNNENVALD